MSRLRIVGFDPSMSNWGIATGSYCLDTGEIIINTLGVTQPTLPKGKQVRQSSKDLEAAQQLAAGVMEAVKGVQAIFVEVPHGSKSIRAAVGRGVCTGILGMLRASGTPFFELTEGEVKMGSLGQKKNVTKAQMIQWAKGKYPDAPWPLYKQKGEMLLSEAKAEHMADAIATIEAGVKSPLFRQLALLRA